MNKERYEKAVALRREGKSYREIMEATGYARGTLSYHFKKLGLEKPVRPPPGGNQEWWDSLSDWEREGSVFKFRQTHQSKKEVDKWLERFEQYKRKDPIKFWSFIMLYEAEGTKQSHAAISNQDWRLLKLAQRVLTDMRDEIKFKYSVQLPETLKKETGRVKNYWAEKMEVSRDEISIYYTKYNSSREYDNENGYTGIGRISGGGLNLIRAILITSNKFLNSL